MTELYSIDDLEWAAGCFSLSVEGCVLEKGNVYSVVGPNGAGKSSLLSILAFLRRPDRGSMRFNGAETARAGGAELLSLRRQVSCLMQNPYLFDMSVADNIGYGLRARGLPCDEVHGRVESIMKRMSLSHLSRRNAHQLSGGEVQRVALARTLVLDTVAVVLDEPTAHVDRRSVHEVEGLIVEMCRERNATVVLATHSLDQAYRMSRNVLSIVDGRVRGVGYENVFEGRVSRSHAGVASVRVADGIDFLVAGDIAGDRATIAIDPEDILLSRDRLTSSALNAFHGTITRADAAAGPLRVFVDVGVSLCAAVTGKSFEEMGLNVGKQVWLTFKATAVKVL